MSKNEISALLGSPIAVEVAKSAKTNFRLDLDINFDARDQWPNCPWSVRDQVCIFL